MAEHEEGRTDPAIRIAESRTGRPPHLRLLSLRTRLILTLLIVIAIGMFEWANDAPKPYASERTGNAG